MVQEPIVVIHARMMIQWERFGATSTHKISSRRESESSKESEKGCKKREGHGYEHCEADIDRAGDKPKKR